MALKPHQTEAVQAIVANFEKHARTQYMACGSGKTLVGLGVANEFEDLDTLLILVPSLALVRQVRMSYNGYMAGDSVSYMAVCSDQTVGEDEATVSPDEVGCPVTTNADEVRTFVEDIANGLRVVFCTYQSAWLLQDLTFDLGIFDEAHKTAGGDKSFSFALSDDNVTIHKRLFMTATPRHAKVSKEGTEAVFSMDDEKTYGPVAYRLSFREAVNRGIICDYRILISGLIEEANTDHEAAMQVALEKAMRKVGAKKAFTFHRSVAGAQSFAANKDGVLKSKALHINGAQNTDVRSEIMRAFEKPKKAVLTNARCLTEGVDVPTVDMVAFIDPKSSTIDIVQAAGRAMRKSDETGKKRGYIFLPVFVRRDEKLDDAIDRSGFTKIWDVVQAMQEQDEVLSAAIRNMRERQLDGEDVEGESLPNIEFMGGEGAISVKDLERAITVRVMERLSGVSSVDANLKQLQKLYDAGEDRPSMDTKLGRALVRYTSPSSASILPEVRGRFKRWFVDTVEENLKQLQKLYDAGEDRPSQKTKLGKAISSYVAQSSSCYRPEVRGRFKRWFVDTVEENLKQLQKLYDAGEKKPSRKTPLGRTLAGYVAQSSSCYRPEVRGRFKRWFVDTVEENLKQLQKLYDAGEKRPSAKTKLGMTLSSYVAQSSSCYRPGLRKEFKRWFPDG
jgi:predicted helicase/uncharacterized protein YfaT (DUF1175 family)